jgi:hypothetical protein
MVTAEGLACKTSLLSLLHGHLRQLDVSMYRPDQPDTKLASWSGQNRYRWLTLYSNRLQNHKTLMITACIPSKLQPITGLCTRTMLKRTDWTDRRCVLYILSADLSSKVHRSRSGYSSTRNMYNISIQQATVSIERRNWLQYALSKVRLPACSYSRDGLLPVCNRQTNCRTFDQLTPFQERYSY